LKSNEMTTSVSRSYSRQS